MQTHYIITESESGLTVQEFIRQHCRISAREYQRLMRAKKILLNKKPPYSKRLLKTGDKITMHAPKDNTYGVVPETHPLTILYEDDRLLVIAKPPYTAVHPMGKTTMHTLSNYVAGYYAANGSLHTVRPVHRLDRNTSGCILFAKTKEAQQDLGRQLQEGRCKRTYLAVVKGALPAPAGSFTDPIAVSPHSPNQRCVSAAGEPSHTDYTVLEEKNGHSLLLLSLRTGRTHQIRVHLAHAGAPIVGDSMYGVPSPLIKRQALHALRLRWQNTNGQICEAASPLPNDWKTLWNQLEFSSAFPFE